jgi:hypothetical protein
MIRGTMLFLTWKRKDSKSQHDIHDIGRPMLETGLKIDVVGLGGVDLSQWFVANEVVHIGLRHQIRITVSECTKNLYC